MREAWLEVKRMYDTLVAWYEDSMYYHYVGFLTTQGKTLHDMLQASRKQRKMRMVKKSSLGLVNI